MKTKQHMSSCVTFMKMSWYHYGRTECCTPSE